MKCVYFHLGSLYKENIFRIVESYWNVSGGFADMAIYILGRMGYSVF